MKTKTLIFLILAVSSASCKPRSHNDDQNDAGVLSLPNPPGLKEKSGFAYGTEENDPAYRRELENKKKSAVQRKN